MPRRKRSCGHGRAHRLVFGLALAALILAAAAPQADAHFDSTDLAHKHWDGDVGVSTTTLTITEGTSGTYDVSLTHEPVYYRYKADGTTEEAPCEPGDSSCEWWVFFHVTGHPRGTAIDGHKYDLDGDGDPDIRVVPSIGREFSRTEYPVGTNPLTVKKNFRIHALEDDDTEDQTVVFHHEVWGDDTDCPIHNTGHVTIRIIDNDTGTPSLPTLSIWDATATEGDKAEFTVTLSEESAQTVTVGYTTHQGTALTSTDFTGNSGTLSFPAGTTEKVIEVSTREDTTDEPDETFTVKLTSPNNATLLDDVGIGTITDDDPFPALSIGDATVEEGGTASFAVTLSPESARTVTVAYRTFGGTAAEGSDYEAKSDTLTFTAGMTSQTVQVVTKEDTDDEPDESFTVRLSSPNNATLMDNSGSGTITDDDDDAIIDLPTLSIGDASADEGETASFGVTLAGTSTQTVTVAYQTFGGTAVEGTDYVAASDTLTFAVGTTQQTIEVLTSEDTDDEPDESFTVRLSSPTNAILVDDSGSGTIRDDDEGDNDGNDGNGGNGGNGNNNGNGNGQGPVEEANWKVLPELARAMAFSAVRCRIEDAFSDMARGWAKPSARSSLSLLSASTPSSRPPAPTFLRESGAESRSPTLEQVLGNGSFLLPLTGGDGGTTGLSTWGCGDYRDLSGDGGGRTGAWDGETFSVQVGADAMLDNNVLAGVSLTRSKGELEYVGANDSEETGGRYDLQLTGIHPYVGWWVSPKLELWGTVGLGRGELRIADKLVGASLTSDATLVTAAVGVNGRLLESGATRLRLKGEWALAQLNIEGQAGVFRDAAINLRRTRIAAEVDHEQVIPYVGVFAPWGELGLRHDGGDGENGASLEVGGGLHLRNIEQGWNVEAYGRWLAVQQDSLPEERGFGARFRYDPGTPGFGPWIGLTQSWGETGSGVQQLWEDDATGPTPYDPPTGRLDAEVAYGFAAFGGRGALTPYGAVSLEGADARGYRMGGRMALGPSATMSLEAERREDPAGPPRHTVGMRSSARF